MVLEIVSVSSEYRLHCLDKYGKYEDCSTSMFISGLLPEYQDESRPVSEVSSLSHGED